MKFTFSLDLSSPSSQRREKLVLDSSEGEASWHVTLKLLAYLLFREWGPRIEASAGWHFKPDLYAEDPSGRINLWVDCGNVALRKIDSLATKVGRAVRFVILRRDKRETDRLRETVAKRVRHAERVEFIHFDDGFVDALTEAVERTNDLQVNVAPDTLQLRLNNSFGSREWVTQVHRLPG